MQRKLLLSLAGAIAISASAATESQTYTWKKHSGNLTLMAGTTPVGSLAAETPKGVKKKLTVAQINPNTFKVTATYTATATVDSARLTLDFVSPAPSSYWMIPSVSYNGNHWGRGEEPKGAKHEGEWRTYSYRATPIPGATYSEGPEYAVAMWSDVPASESASFSCSVMPDTSTTTHRIIWPEEEMPVTYVARDVFNPGFRKCEKLKKGDKVTLTAYLSATPVRPNHYAMHDFLTTAWQRAQKTPTDIYTPAKIWNLSQRYAKEYLWTEDGDYRGFTIGFYPDKDGKWAKARGYEIGWCGQNISFANSLLTDYLAHGNRESLDKGMAALDSWAKLCRLPNGLVITNYDRVMGRNGKFDDVVMDACNLGTAAMNYFEAHTLAKECGLERPEFEDIAYGICDFARRDQQRNGCYGRGWYPTGECYYREGTIGAFLLPPMLEAYTRTQNRAYLASAVSAYRYYVSELKEMGYSTAGALDTWCIDKESSISLLRAALKLYRLTGEKQYLEDALGVSYYLSTWLWHYNDRYDANDNFTVYNYKTLGATSVSTQHHHLDPYAVLWVPEWMELTQLTGDPQWREKALAVWNNACQLISDGTLEINGMVRPVGSQNEAYFQSYWNWDAAKQTNRINSWLVAWPCSFRMETLRKLNAMKAEAL